MCQTARPGLSIASPGVPESSLSSWYQRGALAVKEDRPERGAAGASSSLTRLHAPLLKGQTFRLKLRALLKITREWLVGPGGEGQLGPGSLSRAALPFRPPLTADHVLLAREGELGWGGQGASTKTPVGLCILPGSFGGASQGAGNASLFLKTTAQGPVKRLSFWGQSSSGPTSLARSRPSITSWRLTEWLIVSALLREQMARPCALLPPPARLPESFKQHR